MMLISDVQWRSTPLSHFDITLLPGCIGGDWWLLAQRIGLNPVEIDHIKQDNHTTGTQILKAFNKIFSNFEAEDNPLTLEDLRQHIKAVPNLTVDWQKLNGKFAKNGM